jgi:hypothetical protein
MVVAVVAVVVVAVMMVIVGMGWCNSTDHGDCRC